MKYKIKYAKNDIVTKNRRDKYRTSFKVMVILK